MDKKQTFFDTLQICNVKQNKNYSIIMQEIGSKKQTPESETFFIKASTTVEYNKNNNSVEVLWPE